MGCSQTEPESNDFLKSWCTVKDRYFGDPLHALHFLQQTDF
jgi:hypothetical protein